MDSSSQFEKQLSAQWHQIANKMGVPCNQSSNSQPIKGRLSQAIGFLVDEGKSQKEALHIVQTAVNTILGTDSEAEMNKLLELEVHHLLITVKPSNQDHTYNCLYIPTTPELNSQQEFHCRHNFYLYRDYPVMKQWQSYL